MDYEHWDLGSIFAGIEHLIGLEQRRIKSLHLNLSKLLQTWKARSHNALYLGTCGSFLRTDSGAEVLLRHVTVVDDTRTQERDKTVEYLRVLSLP